MSAGDADRAGTGGPRIPPRAPREPGGTRCSRSLLPARPRPHARPFDSRRRRVSRRASAERPLRTEVAARRTCRSGRTTSSPSSPASTSSPRSSTTRRGASSFATPSTGTASTRCVDFGGIRIEDDVRVTADGSEVLTRGHTEDRRPPSSRCVERRCPRDTSPCEHITLTDVARQPRPGMVVPAALSFTPDGSGVTYLFSEEGNLVRSLWRYDIATGERTVLAGPPPASTSRGQAVSRRGAPARACAPARARCDELPVGEAARIRRCCSVPAGGKLYAVGGVLFAARAGWHRRRHRPAPLARRSQRCLRSRRGALRRHACGRRSAAAHHWRRGRADQRPRRVHRPGGARPRSGLLVERRRHAHRVHPRRQPSHPLTTPSCTRATPRWRSSTTATRSPARPTRFSTRSRRCRVGRQRMDGPRRDRDIYIARVRLAAGRRADGQILSRDQKSSALLRSILPPARRQRSSTSAASRGSTSTTILASSSRARFFAAAKAPAFRHLYLHEPTAANGAMLTSGEWVVTQLSGLDEERRLAYFAATQRFRPRAPPLRRLARRRTDSKADHGAGLARRGRRARTAIALHRCLERRVTRPSCRAARHRRRGRSRAVRERGRDGRGARAAPAGVRAGAQQRRDTAPRRRSTAARR